MEERRPQPRESENQSKEVQFIYDKLDRIILPMFYNNWDRFIDVMRNAIAIDGSFFNTHRVM